MEVCMISSSNSSLKFFMHRSASFLTERICSEHPSQVLLSKDISKSGSYYRRCPTQSSLNLNNEDNRQSPEKALFESTSEIGDTCMERASTYFGDNMISEKSGSFELKATNFINREVFNRDMELAENGELREMEMKSAETCDRDIRSNKRLYENDKCSPEDNEGVSVSFSANSSLVSQNPRAKPRNPRLGMGETTLADVAKKLENRRSQQPVTTNSHAFIEAMASDTPFTPAEKFLLKQKLPDLSKIKSEKWPLLHTLVTSGQELYLDKFLKQGADVNVIDKDGYSAIQRAVLAKKKTAVNLLLGGGADVTACDKDGASLLHYSVQTGSMSLVKLFVDRGVDVNSADKYGWTPLHLAVISGRADIVRLLIVNGGDKSLSNKDGYTPLDLSLSLGRGFNSAEVAKALKKLSKTSH